MALPHCVMVGLQSMIVVFPDHNHLIILGTTDNLPKRPGSGSADTICSFVPVSISVLILLKV